MGTFEQKFCFMVFNRVLVLNSSELNNGLRLFFPIQLVNTLHHGNIPMHFNLSWLYEKHFGD